MTKNMRYTDASDCSEYQPSSGRVPHSSGPGEGQIFTGLPKSARMAKRREFLAVTDRANPPDLKFSAGCFLLLGRENGLGRNRLGVTVTKKTASRAVDRNRIKRIVREFFRLNNYQWPSGFDFVFIAKRGAAEAENSDLRSGLEKIGRKLADRKTAEPEDDRLETGPAPEQAGYSGPGEKPEKPWPVQAFLAIADFFEWLLKGLALGLIYIYQRLISPLLPPSCRFRPTCSRYAVQAITIHGFWRGAYLTVRRLLKCHPFHPGGYDPVPPKKTGT